MHRINEVGYGLLPIVIVVGGLVGLILHRAGFRHGDDDCADCRRDGVCRGPQLHLRRRHDPRSALPLIVGLAMSADYRRRRWLSFLEPLGGPARRRVPDHPVAHRGRHRRHHRARA